MWRSRNYFGAMPIVNIIAPAPRRQSPKRFFFLAQLRSFLTSLKNYSLMYEYNFYVTVAALNLSDKQNIQLVNGKITLLRFLKPQFRAGE